MNPIRLDRSPMQNATRRTYGAIRFANVGAPPRHRWSSRAPLPDHFPNADHSSICPHALNN